MLQSPGVKSPDRPQPIRGCSVSQVRRAFEEAEPLTVGVEEEVMLLDPETLDLTPRAGDVLERLARDARFKHELPNAQVEQVTLPAASVGDVLRQLQSGRRDLAEAAAGLALPAAAGLHPFAPPLGELNVGQRYAHTRERYGVIAQMQQVCALQVHVAVGGADLTLEVYNALRPHLPEIAALAANAPFYVGADTGFASMRPIVCGLLPRQGIPPVIRSWEDYAAIVRWGAAADVMSDTGQWWWELRPNPVYGTLEVRVPDAQSTLEDAAAVIAFIHALVARLRAGVIDGEEFDCGRSWRIAEDRWSAARYGANGTMADPEVGSLEPTRLRLERTLADIEPFAADLGCAAELLHARDLVRLSGADQQRLARDRGGDVRAVAGWLAEVFSPDRRGAR